MLADHRSQIPTQGTPVRLKQLGRGSAGGAAKDVDDLAAGYALRALRFIALSPLLALGAIAWIAAAAMAMAWVAISRGLRPTRR